jgi:membrane protease YdiL (CAAX protease family)
LSALPRGASVLRVEGHDDRPNGNAWELASRIPARGLIFWVIAAGIVVAIVAVALDTSADLGVLALDGAMLGWAVAELRLVKAWRPLLGATFNPEFPWQQVALVVAAGLAAAAGLSLITDSALPTAAWLRWMRESWVHSKTPAGGTFAGAITALAICGVAVAPPVEELVFRGILLPRLAFKLGWRRGLITTALLFMVLHPILNWPVVFLLGLAYGVLYRRSKNLLAPVLAHFAANAFALGSVFPLVWLHAAWTPGTKLACGLVLVAASVPLWVLFFKRGTP